MTDRRQEERNFLCDLVVLAFEELQFERNQLLNLLVILQDKKIASLKQANDFCWRTHVFLKKQDKKMFKLLDKLKPLKEIPSYVR